MRSVIVKGNGSLLASDIIISGTLSKWNEVKFPQWTTYTSVLHPTEPA